MDISEHGRYSSDSIENKVVTTMKSKFYFTTGYNKQVKQSRISKYTNKFQ